MVSTPPYNVPNVYVHLPPRLVRTRYAYNNNNNNKTIGRHTLPVYICVYLCIWVQTRCGVFRKTMTMAAVVVVMEVRFGEREDSKKRVKIYIYRERRSRRWRTNVLGVVNVCDHEVYTHKHIHMTEHIPKRVLLTRTYTNKYVYSKYDFFFWEFFTKPRRRDDGRRGILMYQRCCSALGR